MKNGFTLIEIAIVLVITGLLLGGIIKGRELLENAKIRAIKDDINMVSSGFYAYQDRYATVPGDDADASGRGWADALAGNGQGTLDDDDAFDSTVVENASIWQHLRYAGLISGEPSTAGGGRANPLHSFDGKIGITNVASAGYGLGLQGTILCMGNLPGKAAASVDEAFDDGNPAAGLVRSLAGNNNAEPAAAAGSVNYNQDRTYTVCKIL